MPIRSLYNHFFSTGVRSLSCSDCTSDQAETCPAPATPTADLSPIGNPSPLSLSLLVEQLPNPSNKSFSFSKSSNRLDHFTLSVYFPEICGYLATPLDILSRVQRDLEFLSISLLPGSLAANNGILQHT